MCMEEVQCISCEYLRREIKRLKESHTRDTAMLRQQVETLTQAHVDLEAHRIKPMVIHVHTDTLNIQQSDNNG